MARVFHADSLPPDGSAPAAPAPGRRCFLRNCNFWWCLGLAMTLAGFLPMGKSMHAAQQRKAFGPWLILHLVGSAGIALACLWNILVPASLGKMACKCHRVVGYIGLCASVLGVVSGLITAWWERFEAKLIGLFAGLSAVAALQTLAMVMGYVSIRRAKADPSQFDRYVWRHKCFMYLLWGSCLGPMFFRIPQVFFGVASSSELMFLGLIPSMFWPWIALRASEKRSFF